MGRAQPEKAVTFWAKFANQTETGKTKNTWNMFYASPKAS